MELSETGAADHEDALSELIEDRRFGRRLAAHHEAGHLAVAWALGGHLISGDVIRTSRFYGTARFRIGSDGFGASVERIIATLAGPVAQGRFSPFNQDGGTRDREQVAQQLDTLCRCPDAAAIVLRHCQAEASRLVESEWDAVEALAAAFLERECLTSIELAAILADVAERRRRARWRAVELSTGAQPTTEDTACPGST